MKRFSITTYTSAFFLFIGTIGIILCKMFLFTSARFFYILSFISFITLIILLFKKHFNFIQFTKNFLLLTLPTEIALLVATNMKHGLHWIFYIATGVWLLILSLIIIYKWSQKHPDKNLSKQSVKYNFITVSILLTVMILHLGFGLYHLGKSAYVDERLWTYSSQKRIEKYWNNIIQRDWKNTRPSDKPGVTLAILSGPSLFFVTPSDFFKDMISDKESFAHMLFVMRLPLVIFSTLLLVLFYHVVSTILNTKIGLLSTIFIGLSPILLGISRLINPDALSWIFIPLTLYSYFAYQKTKNKNWIYIAGILLGLGLLTKYITNLIFPFFFIFLFIENLFEKHSKEELRENLRNTLSNIGIISLISVMTFYILYPGTWVVLNRVLIGTIWSEPFLPVWKYFLAFTSILALDYFFNRSSIILWVTQKLYIIRSLILVSIPLIFFITIIFTLYHTYLAQNPIDFEAMLASPKTIVNEVHFQQNAQALITSFYTLIFGISPIALTGVFFTLFFFIKKNTSIKISQKIFIWNMLFFILIFYIGSIYSTTIPTVRYQIILYPIILTISAFGWYYFLKTIQLNKNIYFNIFIVIIIMTSAYALYIIKPFYFSYNSLLLPKDNIINIKDMGDGSYEAAQYLNNLPNAKNLNIWSDKNGVCTFFVGKCVNIVRKSDFIENGPHYDYFVISKGRESRTIDLSRAYSQMRPDYPVRLDLLYSSPDAIFEIFPGNRPINYIRIIPEEKIHVWRGDKSVK